MTDKSEK